MTGLFMEIGPSLIDKQGHMRHNPYSWNNNASVLFLDQPITAGFSYNDNGESSGKPTACASKDVVAFLTLFFAQFPQYSRQAFHIAGESYAGHHVPQIALDILWQRESNINLKSIMIGNGLLDPYTQYEYYGPMACGKGGHGRVVDRDTCSSMDRGRAECQSYIQNCQEIGGMMCKHAREFCKEVFLNPYIKAGRSVYNIDKKCDGNERCYGEITQITKYLNRAEVKHSLGVEKEFKSCSDTVNWKFLSTDDNMKPVHKLIPRLLQKVPALIYAGDADYICNWLGIDAWTKALDWDGTAQFGNFAPIEVETRCRNKYGSIKHAEDLAFLRVYNAGHMVGHDQPSAAFDFVNRWMRGEWQKKKR